MQSPDDLSDMSTAASTSASSVVAASSTPVSPVPASSSPRPAPRRRLHSRDSSQSAESNLTRSRTASPSSTHENGNTTRHQRRRSSASATRRKSSENMNPTNVQQQQQQQQQQLQQQQEYQTEIDTLTLDLSRAHSEIVTLKQRLTNQVRAHEADQAAAVALAIERERAERDRRIKAAVSAGHTAVQTAQTEMNRAFEKRFGAYQASLGDHQLLHTTRMQEGQVRELAAQLTLQEMMLAVQRNEIHALERHIADALHDAPSDSSAVASHQSQVALLEQRHAKLLAHEKRALADSLQAQETTHELLQVYMQRCSEHERARDNEREEARQRIEEIQQTLTQTRHIAQVSFTTLANQYHTAATSWSDDRQELFHHIRRKDDVIARQDDSIARLLFENSQLLRQLQSLGVFSMGSQTHTEHAARITADRAAKQQQQQQQHASHGHGHSSPHAHPHHEHKTSSSPQLGVVVNSSTHNYGNVRFSESNFKPIVLPNVGNDPFQFAATLPLGTMGELVLPQAASASGTSSLTATPRLTSSHAQLERPITPIRNGPHLAPSSSMTHIGRNTTQVGVSPTGTTRHAKAASQTMRVGGSSQSSTDLLAAINGGVSVPPPPAGGVRLPSRVPSDHSLGTGIPSNQPVPPPLHTSSHSIAFLRDQDTLIPNEAEREAKANQHEDGGETREDGVPSMSHLRTPSLVYAVTSAYPGALLSNTNTASIPSVAPILSPAAPPSIRSHPPPGSVSVNVVSDLSPDVVVGISSEWRRYQTYKQQQSQPAHRRHQPTSSETERERHDRERREAVQADFQRRQRESNQNDVNGGDEVGAVSSLDPPSSSPSLLPSPPPQSVLHYVTPAFELPLPLPTPEERHTNIGSSRTVSATANGGAATDRSTDRDPSPTTRPKHVPQSIHVVGPTPPPAQAARNGLSAKANALVAQSIQSSLPITYTTQTSSSGTKSLALQLSTPSPFVSNSISVASANGRSVDRMRDRRGKRLKQPVGPAGAYHLPNATTTPNIPNAHMPSIHGANIPSRPTTVEAEVE